VIRLTHNLAVLVLLAIVSSTLIVAGQKSALKANVKQQITVTPSAVTLPSGASQQFTASPTDVTWSATAGTITSTGLFTAPTVSSQTSITVRAQKRGVSGTAAVTVNPQAVQYAVDLSWTASTTPTVTSYNIYRKIAGGAYASVASAIAGTVWTDDTAQSGQSYVYVATAIDGAKESAYSNELTVVIP
jgi:hypothetical protein